jgi:hypothetical protein
MFEVDPFDKDIIVARRAKGHVEAIRRTILGSSKKGFAYDWSTKDKGKFEMPQLKNPSHQPIQKLNQPFS